MPSDAQRRLGRGLSALLGEDSDDYARLDRLKTSRQVGIDQLRPGRFQPRRRMSEAELDELANSIAARGILQPLLVRRTADDPAAFEIVAGERRWRAAQRAGLHEVPVLVRELADGEALEVALVENLQRQDLSPLEEAEGFRRLMDDFGHTQEALAKVIGKSRSHVANCLRLLTLPETVKALIETGELTAGHARALVTADDPTALAAEVVGRGLTVRATEDLARKPSAEPQPLARVGRRRFAEPKDKDPNTAALERDLSAVLGLAVEIRFRGQGGTLILHYQSLDQLDDILLRLNRTQPQRPSSQRADGATLLPPDPEDPEDREDSEQGGDEDPSR